MGGVPGRAVPWAALGVLMALTAGAATLEVVTAPASPLPAAAAGARHRPEPPSPPSVSPVRTPPATVTPVTVVPAVPPGPPNPAPPGPLSVDAAAWAGHGDLAFVSSGQLEVLSDAGTVTAVTGPPPGGFDSNPAWSSDGRWLAFLHTGPPNGFAIPAATLWLVQAGSTGAVRVGTSGVTTYAWSPVTPVLGFALANSSATAAPMPEYIGIEQPGGAPRLIEVGTGAGIGDIAWSPGGQLGFDDSQFARPATPTAAASPPYGRIGTVDPAKGTVTTALQLTETELRLGGWWPDGGGFLFWEDPGFAEAADGEVLYSVAVGSTQPVAMTKSLVGSTWISLNPDPGRNLVAVMAGMDREIWSPGREVDVCTLPTATCSGIGVPVGSEGLAPSWAPDGGLYFAEASNSGPFGPTGNAFWSPGWMAQWDATNTMWKTAVGGNPAPLLQAPAGTVAAVPAAASSSVPAVLFVADDAIWLANPTLGAPAVRVAGPLFSTAAPSGYYGEVDWTAALAWSAAPVSGQSSAQLLDESLSVGESQTP
jgi:hypothetical protein